MVFLWRATPTFVKIGVASRIGHTHNNSFLEEGLHGKPDILESNAWHSQPLDWDSYQFGINPPTFAAQAEKKEKKLSYHKMLETDAKIMRAWISV